MSAARQGIVSLTIKDRGALYVSYMPFISNGGLFVPTTKPYKIGDEVFLFLTLMEERERIPVPGKVVWVTPPGAQGNKVPGVGVQFSNKDEGATRSKIESYLGASLSGERITQTM